MKSFCHDYDDDDDNKQEEDTASFLVREEEICVPTGSNSSSAAAADETRGGDDAKQQQQQHPAAAIHPFEWLTSLESLGDVLRLALETSTNTNSTTDAAAMTTTNTTDSTTGMSSPSAPRAAAARVLDIGCGSSMLGEYLLSKHSTLRRLVSQVVNVDKDPATLQAMQERWKQQKIKNKSLNIINNNSDDDDDIDDTEDRLLFLPPIDFVEQSIECPPPPPSATLSGDSSGSSLNTNTNLFHVIVDKSTLDCALCTDYAAAALLCQVYRLLRRDNGVYLVISFHHVHFLQPLLQDLPGADWELSFHVIHRQVEKDAAADMMSNVYLPPPQQDSSCFIHHNGTDASPSASAWSSGCFNPNDDYRRTVNAVLCRRRGSKEKPSETETTISSTICNNNNLDRHAVYQHINDTIEQWYRFQNPLLTDARSMELQQAFSSSCQEDDEKNNCSTKLHQAQQQERLLDLPSAFVALFTPAEREHLTYEHFLEDWRAFHDERPELPADMLSYETAAAFLQEMQ